MTPDAPRPDLDAAEVRVVARRICAALEVDVMEDGWAEECLGKIAALADAHAELARLRAAPPVHADRLHVIGDHLCAETDGCTCGAGDPHHERYCGLEPIADLAAVRRALAAAPAPAEEEARWCPTCEVHVVAYSTFTDDKTGWRCCSACTTALTAGPSARLPRPVSRPTRQTRGPTVAEHRWREALGGSLANRFPLVCANCLMRSDSPEAEEPCDQLVLPPAEREGGGQR